MSINNISALSIYQLTSSYRDTPVLDNVSFSVPQGVMLAIIGPNGAGKTTLIKSILGLIKPVSGEIFILGEPAQKVMNKVAYIPQKSSIDWDFPTTVFDMVLMGCYGRLGLFARPGKDEKNKAWQALEKVGLQDYAQRPIGKLSGGQQQRVFVARALLQDAQIYFLDEPLVGIDAITEKIIISLFKQLRDAGKTIIVVHHDLQTAPTYFDWALLLNKQCIACGPINEVFSKQHIASAYGQSSWHVTQHNSKNVSSLHD